MQLIFRSASTSLAEVLIETFDTHVTLKVLTILLVQLFTVSSFEKKIWHLSGSHCHYINCTGTYRPWPLDTYGTHMFLTSFSALLLMRSYAHSVSTIAVTHISKVWDNSRVKHIQRLRSCSGWMTWLQEMWLVYNSITWLSEILLRI